MIKLFTHTDLDGVGCAILAKRAFEDNVDISYCNYDEINSKVKRFLLNDIDNYEICYITDISISDELAEEINKTNPSKFRLFDHHSSAEYLNKYGWCKVTTTLTPVDLIKTCGTELFYYYVVLLELPIEDILADKYFNFVYLVRTYDTWDWVNMGDFGKQAKSLNDLFHIHTKEEFVDDIVEKLKSNKPLFSETDKVILDLKQKEIDAYIEKKDNKMVIRTGTDGESGESYSFGMVFADRFISELGNRLCTMHPEILYVAMVNLDESVVSLRTVRDDIHLGELAKAFGGGGHPKAAAFHIDVNEDIFDYFLIKRS